VRIRIYDHAGKINLNRIDRSRLQQVIEKQLGGEDADPRQVQELLAAWSDWTDLNDVPDSLGAEDETYLELDPPYTTRNNAELDSVEELRLIRGFDELFGDLNLEAAFTIYGNSSAVNPNLATREALMLLPGMTLEAVEAIFALREQRDIQSMNWENGFRLKSWWKFHLGWDSIPPAFFRFTPTPPTMTRIRQHKLFCR
jgi:general secretion pathway protein K